MLRKKINQKLTNLISSYTSKFLILGKEKRFPNSILKDKKIIVIGPADSANDYLASLEENNFDYIIRVNRGPSQAIKNKGSFCSRTDIWFHCMNFDLVGGGGPIEKEVIDKQSVQWLVYPLHEDQLELSYAKNLIDLKETIVYRIPRDIYKALKKEYPARWPTTGLATLVFLMSQEFKELHISGFTFTRTPYDSTYRPELNDLTDVYKLNEISGNHDLTAELCIFAKFYNEKLSDGRNIIIDSTLKTLVSRNAEVS